MTLGKLLKIVDEAYGPQREILHAFHDEDGGDLGLPGLIVKSLKASYDSALSDREQIEAALRALRSSRRELEDVIKALTSHHQ